MSRRDKKLLLESLNETSAYNQDFSDLKEEYLYQSSNEIIIPEKFKYFIKSEYSGYYYKKALFFYVIRFILMLVQLLLFYLWEIVLS